VCAYFVMYRGGKVLHQFMTQYPKSQYRSAVDWPDVTIGPNRFSDVKLEDLTIQTLDQIRFVVAHRWPIRIAH